MNAGLWVAMLEFVKLKDEQIKRIQFRDSMVHLHLVAVGAVFAFAWHDKSYVVLLLVPWVCAVLGWTYLGNDDKIAAIGRYLRNDMRGAFERFAPDLGDAALAWERAHRSDEKRLMRQLVQLIIDEVTFCASGFVALAIFVLCDPTFSVAQSQTGLSRNVLFVVCGIEGIMLAVLGGLFWAFADFRRERRPSRIVT